MTFCWKHWVIWNKASCWEVYWRLQQTQASPSLPPPTPFLFFLLNIINSGHWWASYTCHNPSPPKIEERMIKKRFGLNVNHCLVIYPISQRNTKNYFKEMGLLDTEILKLAEMSMRLDLIKPIWSTAMWENSNQLCSMFISKVAG